VWASDDTTHPDHWWALDHHEPHFALVDGAAARHDDLLRAFRAHVGPLDDPKAVEALTIGTELPPNAGGKRRVSTDGDLSRITRRRTSTSSST
jgi:hypothetical protein